MEFNTNASTRGFPWWALGAAIVIILLALFMFWLHYNINKKSIKEGVKEAFIELQKEEDAKLLKKDKRAN